MQMQRHDIQVSMSHAKKTFRTLCEKYCVIFQRQHGTKEEIRRICNNDAYGHMVPYDDLEEVSSLRSFSYVHMSGRHLVQTSKLRNKDSHTLYPLVREVSLL